MVSVQSHAVQSHVQHGQAFELLFDPGEILLHHKLCCTGQAEPVHCHIGRCCS